MNNLDSFIRQVLADYDARMADKTKIIDLIFCFIEHDRNYLKYADLLDGADIEFSMSDTPDKSRGTSSEARPYSFSRESQVMPAISLRKLRFPPL